MIPYLSPVVELYLHHLIAWDEYFALRKGSDADSRTERETLETVLQTAAQIRARVRDRPADAVRRHGQARLGARRHIRIAAPRAHRVVAAAVPLR